MIAFLGGFIMQIKRIEDVTPEDIANMRFGELTPEEEKEVQALLRADITPTDLEGYADLENGAPFDELLCELEAAQKKIDSRSAE